MKKVVIKEIIYRVREQNLEQKEVENFELRLNKGFENMSKIGVYKKVCNLSLQNRGEILMKNIENLNITHFPNSNKYNMILEGDNIDSLGYLKGLGIGFVKTVVIDPPYNTLKKDSHGYNDKINDEILDENSTYVHSKWADFMRARLVLAKELMTDDGVIFINIDEYEFANLKILCDEVFGLSNHVRTFYWVKNKNGNNSKTTSTKHEYIYCYAKNKDMIKNILDYDEAMIRNNKDGAKELPLIVKDVHFNYPKPISLIKRLIEISDNKDGIILDFFAGSGTAGQATLELNKEDGGTRQFILCTNNENDICTNITYPRIKKVINGYIPYVEGAKRVEGLKSNLKYYKV